MSKKDDNNEKCPNALIDNLCGDLKPMKRLHPPMLRAAFWFVFAAAYVAVVVWVFGLRPDLNGKLIDASFLFEVVLMGTIAITGILSSVWMCIPCSHGKKWLAVVTLTLVSVFTAWTIIRNYTEGLHLDEIHFHHCMHNVILMGAVPAILMFVLTVRGRTTCPFTMIAMNALAIIAVGYVGMRLSCVNDTVEHVVIAHVLPYVLLGGVAGLLARRIYKW